MYKRKELLDRTPDKDRPALTTALQDGHTLDIGIGAKGLVVHHVTPAHQLSAVHERGRALDQSKRHGIERDR